MGSEPYTPWDDEIIDAYRAMRAREIGGDPVLASVESIAEASRWMADHDARVRKEQRKRDAQIAEQADPVEVALIGPTYIAAAIREDRPTVGPNTPETYWHGAGCEEDDRG